ncbi:MAG: hypothetical protein H6684_01350 [Deltaproteobacteria bacterium]|nr:hypothetical protein [bacterium]MCB9476828.1 hypothetical protein [Deltaproteobacteria bacterium]MCB9487357.1 hypothetical protein [Deltaproteobacteria bacterium]
MDGYREYSATMPGWMKLMTYGVTVLVGIVVPVGVAVAAQQDTGTYWIWIFPVFMLFVFYIAYRYRPKGYRLGETSVEVLRDAGNKAIEYDNIASVKPVPAKVGFRTIGLWRSGGYFGIYGIFWRRDLGVYEMYITRADTLVQITPKSGRALVISPDERERFLAELRDIVAARKLEVAIEG